MAWSGWGLIITGLITEFRLYPNGMSPKIWGRSVIWSSLCLLRFPDLRVYLNTDLRVISSVDDSWSPAVCLESPLDSKEIKPVNPKGNQPWIFIGRTDTEAEAPMLWPSVVKSRLIGKDPDAGKDWWQEEKGTTEDEMVGWHHQCNRQESEQNTLGDSEGQGSLECCSPWVAKSQTQLSNWTCVSELSRMVAVSYSEC